MLKCAAKHGVDIKRINAMAKANDGLSLHDAQIQAAETIKSEYEDDLKEIHNQIIEQYNRNDKEKGGIDDSSIKFSRELPDNTLAIVHNLSLDNLIHADKIGGIAVPSVAVVDKNYMMDSFGEITLIGDKNHFGPEASSENRFFNTDIYSPRYPRVTHIVAYKDFDRFIKSLSDDTKKINDQINAISKDGIESNGLVKELQYKLPIKYEYLVQKGKAPKIPRVAKTIVPTQLKKYIGNQDYFLSRDDEFKKLAVSVFNEEVKDAPNLMINDLASREARNIASHYAEIIEKSNKEKDGKGLINIGGLETLVDKEINESDFKKWIVEKYNYVVGGEEIFTGFTYSGKRKYLDHNLDNVVKILNSSLRGGENFSYGVPSIRAQAAKQFKTIKSLQDARGHLVSNDDMEKLKDEVNKEFDKLDSELQPYQKYSRNEAAEALAGLASKGYREFKEYYDNVPQDVMQHAVEFLNKLKHMPSHYFEGKIGRAVGINEFSGAIVPNGKKFDEAITLLKRNGVTNIKRYDRNNSEERSKALQSFNNLLFSKSQAIETPHTKASLTQSIRTTMDKRFGNGWTNALLASGGFRIITENKALLIDKNAVGAKAFYNPADKTTYFIADNIDQNEDITGLMTHELGIHASRLGKNNAEFKAILATVEQLKDSGNAKILEAYARVPKGTPVADINEEILGYTMELYPNLPIVKRFIAWLRNQIRQLAQKLPFVNRIKFVKWANDLTTDDLIFMARGALRNAPTQVNAVTETRGNEAAIMSSAKASGYKGNNTGEAKEWLIAKAKGLDMSKEGRMQRAKDMGFDVKNVFYHGTNKNIFAFDTNKQGENTLNSGWYGAGISVTGIKSEANLYAGAIDGGVIYPLLINKGKSFVINDSFLPSVTGKALRKLEKLKGWSKDELETIDFSIRNRINVSQTFGQSEEISGYRLTEVLKDNGYSSVNVHNQVNYGKPKRNEEIVIFNPKNIRSINAAFDPDYKESSNILASKKDVVLFDELSKHDEIFRYPVSDKQTLEGIMSDVKPDFKLIDSDTRGKITRSIFEVGKTGREFYVFEKDDKVWIDVLGLKSGDSGNAVYAAVGNYAVNAGKVFIGDPKGLLEAAVLRRTNAMLSLALHYGRTDFMEASPEQIKGDTEKGIKPLKWEGDHNNKLMALIDSVTSTTFDSIPILKGYRYDFDNQQFEDKLGRPLRPDWAGRLAREPVARKIHAGEATLRRSVFLKSLASSTSSQKSELLERINSVRGVESAGLNALFSRTDTSKIIGDTERERTPEQLQAFKNVGRSVTTPTIKERMANLWKDAGKKMAQGLVDQFRPIRDLSDKAYELMRLSKGASGAFEVMLHGGQLKLTDGVYNFDDTKNGGVIDRLLTPLQGEADDFLWWVSAHRAEKLSKDDREHLFKPEDIIAIKTLSNGDTTYDFTLLHGSNEGKITNNRAEIYADSLKTFNEFHKNALDMAEQSGLIDGASRKFWESEFYVPFYRVDEEEGIRGINIKSGVIRQQAFKHLKGGTGKLNSDLLDNTLMNWAHLLDASAKNRAAKASIEAAETIGVAEEVEAGTKDSVWFMDNGNKRHFIINDPLVMTAIQSLEYAGLNNPLMKAMSMMKHALTIGVTASPFFKVRNLIRDSLQSIATSGLNYNVPSNIKEGWKLTNPKSDAYFRLLAGGGTIHFGTMLEGSEAKRVRSLIEAGVDESTILDNENKYKAFYKRIIEPAITAYNELGNRGEAINRAALYDQLIKQGKTHGEASLLARDLMDFSMQGSFASIRFLTQIVPFLNARLQGLYKLGRSANEDPKKLGTVLGALSVASITLMLAYSDDDDWKKREDWDRDNYWWFKIGGAALRIPKPFEVGAIASVAERGVELFSSDEMTGERFKDRMWQLLSSNLSMNPVPQLFKPILDIYANKDSFTGRPIETLGMERLDPEYRFTQRTSMAARALSTGSLGAASPVQIDYMIRGYFGWLGTFVVEASDLIAKSGQPERPSLDYMKMVTGGIISGTKDAPSRYVSQMYKQAKEIEQAYGTWKNLQKLNPEEAAKYRTENKELIGKYKTIEAVKRKETALNLRIRIIEKSSKSAEEKRALIRSINEQKDRIARTVI